MTKKVVLILGAFLLQLTAPAEAAQNGKTNDNIKPVVLNQFVEKAKRNNNWKDAVVTGKNGQIVFMNVSRLTNPDNEIGMETHPFDQVILIVEGKGRLKLGEQTSDVAEGDMIFIPQGIEHNLTNLNQTNGLKLISFYSDRDIPSGAVYSKKADAPQH